MIGLLAFILFFSSAVHCHHEKTNVDFCSGIKQVRIRGTDLKTGTFYKVTTSSTDTYQMIWSPNSHPTYGHRYIIQDKNSSNIYKYEKGGSRYFDSQWFFLPAKGYSGWYHLANRAIPGEFATWSYKSGETFASNKFYMVLDPSYSTESPKAEYLFKPIKVGTHYRLKSKSLPNAGISIRDNLYVYVNNDEADSVKYKEGGEWYPYPLFKFEPVDHGKRLNASVSKIELIGSFTSDQNGTATLIQEELATKSIILNNGSSTIIEEYVGQKEIAESVFMHRPVNFANFYKVGVEDEILIEGNPGIPFLKTPSFNQQLISFYSADHESTQTLNFTKYRNFHKNQTIEVPACTEYEISGKVNIVKDYPIEYIVYYMVTGEEDGEQLSSVDLRDENFTNDRKDAANGFHAEYIDILDEYTILAKAKSKMWVTFAKDSTIHGKGVQIENCIAEYTCNQLDS